MRNWNNLVGDTSRDSSEAICSFPVQGRVMKEPQLTIGVISREEAIRLAPDYVDFIEGNFDKFNVVNEAFERLRKGDKVLSFWGTGIRPEGQFVLAKVTSVNHTDYRAIDGPVIRVGNGEYTWRVDGDRYAFPV